MPFRGNIPGVESSKKASTRRRDNMKKVILATKNLGKVKEMASLLKDMDIQVLSLKDIEDAPEVIEDGNTFLENAHKKACAISRVTGLIAISDDSGLEVDALGGAPGIYSARYAGEGASDEENYLKLLDELKDVAVGKRTARFRCVLVVCDPTGRWISAEGACEGRIGLSPRGEHGFGYDPVFLLPDDLTMAEIPPEKKNQLSHRAHALKILKKKLSDFIKKGDL